MHHREHTFTHSHLPSPTPCLVSPLRALRLVVYIRLWSREHICDRGLIRYAGCFKGSPIDSEPTSKAALPFSSSPLGGPRRLGASESSRTPEGPSMRCCLRRASKQIVFSDTLPAPGREREGPRRGRGAGMCLSHENLRSELPPEFRWKGKGCRRVIARKGCW
jgi:hypothetical protein